jgi:hypothetical protein
MKGNNIMKNINLKQILATIACITTIFISQQASAGQHRFVLKTSDNSEVGQGQYEELEDSIAKVVITMQGLEFTGTGIVSKRPSHPVIKGIRSDRAAMGATYQKHVIAELVATNGTKLECELSKEFAEIWGQCINPNNQQTLSIKTLKDEHQ